MIDYERIIQRANIQELHSLFLEGIDLADYKAEPDPKTYEERIRKGEKPLMEFIENLYSDGSVRDAVFDLLSNALLINQEVYTEIGMRVGAKVICELLQIDLAKEMFNGKDKPKR